MLRSRLSKLVPVLVVLLLLMAACGESEDTASGNETTQTEQSATSTAPATSEPTATSTSEATETVAETATQATGTTTEAPEATSTKEWAKEVRTANPIDGMYHLLTFEEAQALVDFTLVMPELPPSMEFASATIALPPAQAPPSGTAMPTGDAAYGTPKSVDLNFRPTSGEQQPVILTESSMSGELGGDAGTTETITIEGVEVTKQTLERDTNTTVVYMWDTQGLNFYLQGFLKPDLPLTTDDFESLIAGTIP